MNVKHMIVATLLLFGSLWGLSEVWLGEAALANEIPRAPLLAAVAVLFLFLARRICDAPGSSLALSAVAASFKFLQHPVWGCKIAAVLIMGAVFDAALSLARSKRSAGLPAERSAVALRAAGATLASFVLFGLFARFVLASPYWASVDRLVRYQFVEGAAGAALAMPAALAGLALGSRIARAAERWTAASAIAYRAAAVGSGVVGAVVALALRF